ncbi:Phospho-2-dehydro-3-deoxyheptonate aldolase (3-deoxy-D-arabino-heptulosonate 7-phosphate synthase) (DAHP synthase) (Phospho-2-keto-3-deoxyheptonate aldolase) [Durusdinium trenchii]|uniref:Phospho-2-dehydro-3-deoxyheptonate aldolase n=1 Tax=Durusdinium trenchii TaxID=1381693 RepID=A0ABP0IQU0_9DINO
MSVVLARPKVRMESPVMEATAPVGLPDRGLFLHARSLPKYQMAEWEDEAVADKVFAKLGKLPPLVQAKECDRLKSLLAEAGRGERFMVQGGDCAERFLDCESERRGPQDGSKVGAQKAQTL